MQKARTRSLQISSKSAKLQANNSCAKLFSVRKLPYRPACQVFQTIVAGGFDTTFTQSQPIQQFLFLTALLNGMMVFAVLVGFVNDSVTTMMEDLNKGATKVACSGHT